MISLSSSQWISCFKKWLQIVADNGNADDNDKIFLKNDNDNDNDNMKPLTISFLLLDNHHHYPWQPYDKLSLQYII